MAAPLESTVPSALNPNHYPRISAPYSKGAGGVLRGRNYYQPLRRTLLQQPVNTNQLPQDIREDVAVVDPKAEHILEPVKILADTDKEVNAEPVEKKRRTHFYVPQQTTFQNRVRLVD